MNDILTSDVLDLAADEIQRRGWVQGSSGWREQGAVCLEGAIAAAMGSSWMETPLHELWSCPAYQAVAEHLGKDATMKNRYSEPKYHLWQFNDARGRTVEDVIAVLRAAAAVERAKEAVAGYEQEDQPLPLDESVAA